MIKQRPSGRASKFMCGWRDSPISLSLIGTGFSSHSFLLLFLCGWRDFPNNSNHFRSCNFRDRLLAPLHSSSFLVRVEGLPDIAFAHRDRLLVPQLSSLILVRVEGLEPPCREALDPKSSVSTNFTTPAIGNAKLILLMNKMR